jgi:proteasome lid subunit RPN8/RPN11
MDNVLGSSTAYEMDPAQLINTLRDLRESGQELVAIYHSHPFGPARPSTTDVQRAYYPDAAHLIVSLAEPERPRAAVFLISSGEILEIDLRVIV